jgi:DNA-binding CsgD family transcriptional regulator/PAS domain-containing protein
MGRSAISDLLERLYDADFSEACFEPFMRALGEQMDSHVLALHTHDIALGRTTMVNAIGVDAGLLARAEKVANDNIWFQRGAAQLLADGLSDDEQLTTPGELHRTRFHADFLSLADLEHGMGLFLGTDTDQSLAVLTINRNGRRGFYTDDERELAKALLPHLRNAFALHRQLRGLQSMEQAYRATLDRLDQPVILLSAHCAVLFANERAQRLEAEGSCLQRRQERPAAVHPADEPLLQAAMSRAVSGITRGEPISMPLRGRDGMVSALLTICPTPPSVFDPWSHSSVAAAIFARPLHPRQLGDEVRIAFGFTAAEFRLASLLLHGFALDEAAERLAISKNTVRSQLRGLFDKTGTRRQSALVALLHRAS